MASEKSKSRGSSKKDKSEKSKKASRKTPPSATYKSAEFVQDSDEEEENSHGKAAKKVSEESSDSDESSSSAQSVKAVSKSNGKLPAPEGSSSSSEDESAESDESSEDEEDSEDAASKAPVTIEPTKQPLKQSATSTVPLRAPPAPYQPPPGFDGASLDGTLKASELLKKSNLQGKQVWYFTAPASIPISEIKAMSLGDAKHGKTVLTHEGNEYGFMKDSAEDTTYTRIMVPSSDVGYKASSKSIDHVFHLQQVAHDPTTANPGRATKPAKKPIRKQPRGLKMRFHPIGFGDAGPGTVGSSSSDEEMEDRPSKTRRPVTKSKLTDYAGGDESDEEMVDAVLPSRPHPDIAASSADAESRKEKKKRKHSEGGEKKSKHSSSSKMKSIDHRELKRLKKKQTESQRNLADNPSASTEKLDSTYPPSPLQSKTPQKPSVSISTTPIPPPKPLTFSQTSVASTGSYHSKSSSKKSKASEEFSSMSPVLKSTPSLKELTRATDPRLTEEERRKKMKKLKHKDAKRQKGNPA
ncbi:hypothetical protein VTL71DRAFT_11550 [Oculimacula yallundae]|uniref:Uncharacterized protein n=1 Tax=Oculimacula yallundae TaxID=86028 RepID=A0ABR4CR49_9HELO